MDRLRAEFTWRAQLVLIGSLAFAISMYWVSWLKYNTFNA